MKRILQTKDFPALIIRLTVGLVFLSEGIQKFLYPETIGSERFAKLGISPPVFWASFTGGFEIVCSMLIILGFLTRLAVLPLLIIMIVAFITTKWPTLIGNGFWPMAHDGRIDFAMTMLLIFLFIYGSGRPSIDLNRKTIREN
jgi:uncharacterized membrane protein YphA (DoxX/SURF4 family)